MNDFLEFLYAHIPHRWLNKNAKGTKRLLEGFAENLAYLNGFIDMLKRNHQTRKAEELITELENEYGIVVNPSYDLAFRREKIVAKMRMQDSPITVQELIKILEMMGFFDVEVKPLLGEFQIEIRVKSPEQCRYKLFEILQMLHENIRAHINLSVEMTTETSMPDKNLYIASVVFGPIIEMILPEIEDIFDFTTKLTVLAKSYSIEDTTLPELEQAYDFDTTLKVIAKSYSIEDTTLPELEQEYDFDAALKVIAKSYSIEDTTLPELEQKDDFNAKLKTITKSYNIESTVLPELLL